MHIYKKANYLQKWFRVVLPRKHTDYFFCPNLLPSDPWWPLQRCHHLYRKSGTVPHREHWHYGSWGWLCLLLGCPSGVLCDSQSCKCFFQRLLPRPCTGKPAGNSTPETSPPACALQSVVGTAGSWAQHGHPPGPPGGSWSCSQWTALWRKSEVKDLFWSPQEKALPRSALDTLA